MILLYIYLIGYAVSHNVIFAILYDPNERQSDAFFQWAMSALIALLWPMIVLVTPAYLFRRRLG